MRRFYSAIKSSFLLLFMFLLFVTLPFYKKLGERVDLKVPIKCENFRRIISLSLSTR